MNTLSILDYNIWFDKHYLAERTLSLIDVIEEKKPDVILMQEVTKKVFEVLILTLTKLGYKYSYPEIINKTYDCIIFSRFPIIETNIVDYDNSRMIRSLITVVIEYPLMCKDKNELIALENTKIVIGTSHFESFFEKKYSEIKKNQYICAKNELDNLSKKYKYVIFGGDTNIANEEEEKSFFKNDNNWIDTWKDFDSDPNNEYTYDTQTNKNLIFRGIKNLRGRTDRILYKGDMITRKYELITEGNFIIPPSDHHGIYVKLEIIT
jgi:exonuclease III